MAVNVNSVYQTVLSILNKEQRGYMTPYEFCKIGSQVQREIFEAYFEDINQNVRVQQTEFDYSNRVYNTDEKIAEFKTTGAGTYDSNTSKFDLPENLYRLNTVTYEPVGNFIELPRLTRNEFYNVNKSKLTKPSKNCPIYLYEDNKLIIFPDDITGKIGVSYVGKPSDVRWGYLDYGTYNIYDPTPYIPNALIVNDDFGFVSNTIFNAVPGDYDIPGDVFGLDSSIIFSAQILSNGLLGNFGIKNGGDGTQVVDQDLILTSIVPDINVILGGTGEIVIQIGPALTMEENTNGSLDFQLHNSERSELVLKILLYAGIVIRDPQIVQTAMAQIQKEEVNEKQ
jgi:hypothetical protein